MSARGLLLNVWATDSDGCGARSDTRLYPLQPWDSRLRGDGRGWGTVRAGPGSMTARSLAGEDSRRCRRLSFGALALLLLLLLASVSMAALASAYRVGGNIIIGPVYRGTVRFSEQLAVTVAPGEGQHVTVQRGSSSSSTSRPFGDFGGIHFHRFGFITVEASDADSTPRVR